MVTVRTARGARKLLGELGVCVGVGIVGLTLAQSSDDGDENAIDCGTFSRSLGMPFDPDPFAAGHACIIQSSDTGTPAVLVERWELTGGGTSTSEHRVIGPGQVTLIGQVTGDDNMSDVAIESRCKGLVMNQGLLEGVNCEATRPPP